MTVRRPPGSSSWRAADCERPSALQSTSAGRLRRLRHGYTHDKNVADAAEQALGAADRPRSGPTDQRGGGALRVPALRRAPGARSSSVVFDRHSQRCGGMRLTHQANWLQISAAPTPPGFVGSAVEPVLALRMEFQVAGVGGVYRSDVEPESWAAFVSEFVALERSRSGEARLCGENPDDFSLRFFATDRAGHMAVEAVLGRDAGAMNTVRVSFR